MDDKPTLVSLEMLADLIGELADPDLTVSERQDKVRTAQIVLQVTADTFASIVDHAADVMRRAAATIDELEQQ